MNSVALLIPHYNNFTGLVRSIGSINQSECIDVIIVDDGSVSEKINEEALKSIFKANGEVVFLYLPTNKGIEYALNFGLDYILNKGYKYTARLDAGDICLGRRFEIQQQYLENNSEIKLLGTNAIANDLEGNFIFKYNFPLQHSDIQKKIFLNAVFVHPTLMFDNTIIHAVGNYPTKYKAAEDFAFTFKIVKNFKTANLAECLVTVELNPKGISISKRKIQVKSRIRVIQDNFYFGFYPIYGWLRNIALFIIPDRITFLLKKIFIHSN